MQNRSTLSVFLMTVLPAVLVPSCSSETVGSTGQMITCSTDPSTGTILRCEPGGGSGGSGSATCQDIDQDGDGDPHDQGDDHPSASGDDNGHDRDHDGIDDDHDCDELPGEDAHRDALPYDVRPQLAATTRPIIDAFAAGGGQPAQIVSVTLDGGSWRLAELQAGTAFVVTQDDCNHAGNRATGRDRVEVTWKTADQVEHSDHLDIRYCK